MKMKVTVESKNGNHQLIDENGRVVAKCFGPKTANYIAGLINNHVPQEAKEVKPDSVESDSFEEEGIKLQAESSSLNKD